MPNPNIINSTVVATSRSVDLAQASRRSASAAGESGDLDRVERVDNLGGEWDPASTRGALAERSPMEDGWGGWSDEGTPPWHPQSMFDLAASGGVHIREKHRETIAGQMYQRHVAGDQKVDVGGDSNLRVRGSHMVLMQSEEASPFGGDMPITKYGPDTLHVKGDAEWHAGEKTTLGAGNVERHWLGGIVRMIGMEGVICGGVFLKTFTGVSTTIAPLASGDVYGGAAHTAGVRVRGSAPMGYRSTELAAWACNYYRRACVAMTEPAEGTPAKNPRTGKGEKALRLAMGMNPLFDIGMGLAGAVAGLAGLAKSAYNKLNDRKEEPEGNTGAPRTLVRTVGGIQQIRTTEKIL